MDVDKGEASDSLRRALQAVRDELTDETRARHLELAERDYPAFLPLRNDIRSLAAAVAALIVKVDALASARQ